MVFGKHPEGLATPALSVGCSHAKVELRLRGDGEPDQGVLEIKCPALMNGYHNRPDLESPMTQDGFNITGDVFRRDENGFYFFVGRSDDMFVSGGENIYPGDVERMLERHPDIGQSCVVPIADEIKGQKPVLSACLDGLDLFGFLGWMFGIVVYGRSVGSIYALHLAARTAAQPWRPR